MIFKDSSAEKAWANTLEVNKTSDYGMCVVRYAEAWAAEMEAAILNGETVEQCASRTSCDVDNRPGFGITGAMFNMAKSLLSQVWKYGDELRQLKLV